MDGEKFSIDKMFDSDKKIVYYTYSIDFGNQAMWRIGNYNDESEAAAAAREMIRKHNEDED